MTLGTWIPFIGPLTVAAFAVVVPGAATSLALGVNRGMAILISPLISVATISTWAVILGILGIRWSIWSILVATVVQVAGAWALRYAVRRGTSGRIKAALYSHGRRTRVVPDAGLDRTVPVVWIGITIGMALWARHLKNILISPDAISQTPDNIFHLSAVRHILDSGNGSSLSLNSIAAGTDGSTFYPAAWHDLASIVALGSGTTVPIAANGALAASVVCWIFSSSFLVWTIVRNGTLGILVAGVLSASFTAFPMAFMYWGALHPNILGLALFPFLAGALVQLFRVAPERKLGTTSALLICAASLPGVGLAHPNALISVFIVAMPVLIDRLLRLSRSVGNQDGGPLRRLLTAKWTAIWLCGTVVISIIAWNVLRPVKDQIRGIPSTSLPGAIGEAMLNGTISGLPAWLVSILVIVGVFSCLHLRKNVWLPLTWIVMVFFWVVGASVPEGDLRSALVGIWYADPFRPAALLPIAALPLAAIGIEYLSDVAGLSKWDVGRVWKIGMTSSVVAAVIVLTQFSGYMDAAIARAHLAYKLSADSALLTGDEYALIMRVPEHVPPVERIAVNPWNGSSMVYPLTDRDTTSKHILGAVSPEQEILKDRLRDVDSDPQVCDVVRNGRIGYVLSFEGVEVRGEDHPYPGFADLADARGFTEVDREGSAVLYRIDVCH